MSWWSRLRGLFRRDEELEIVFTPEEDDRDDIQPAGGGGEVGTDVCHSCSVEAILERLRDTMFLMQVDAAARDLPPHMAGPIYELLGLSKMLLEHTVAAVDALNHNWRIIAALVRQTPSDTATVETREITVEALEQGSLLQFQTHTGGLHLRWVAHTSPLAGEDSRN